MLCTLTVREKLNFADIDDLRFKVEIQLTYILSLIFLDVKIGNGSS